jgi:hypothetical protein
MWSSWSELIFEMAMRALLFGLAFLSLGQFALAHLQGAPDLGTIAKSDAVYLVIAGSSSGAHTLFRVDEILRGSQRASLNLQPYPGGDSFFAGSSWIIFRHSGGFPDCVGWAMKGDCEWLPVSATPGIGTSVSVYRYSVKQIKDYLKSHPANS